MSFPSATSLRLNVDCEKVWLRLPDVAFHHVALHEILSGYAAGCREAREMNVELGGRSDRKSRRLGLRLLCVVRMN